MESGDYIGPVPTAIKNKDYGVDDDGLTIVPTPTWQFTPYALSLFIPQVDNHLYLTTALREGKCYQFVQLPFDLPNGIAVVLDGEIPLKFWENAKDKALKKGGVRQTTNAHYSLICTERMSEATFLENLRHIFQMPQVYPCRIHAAAGLADLTADWEGASDLDGPVRIVHEAAVQLAPLMSGMDRIDVAGLHGHISIEKPTFSSLLSSPFFSRVAFHLLGFGVEIEDSHSAAIRMGAIREMIADRYEWDTDLPYKNVVLPNSGVDDVVDSFKRGLSFSEFEYGEHVPNLSDSEESEQAFLDFYKPFGVLTCTLIAANSVWAVMSFDGTSTDIPPFRIERDNKIYAADACGRITDWIDDTEQQLIVVESYADPIPTPRVKFERILAESGRTRQCKKILLPCPAPSLGASPGSGGSDDMHLPLERLCEEIVHLGYKVITEQAGFGVVASVLTDAEQG
ncbi:uncharacterized protein EV422DRAFT_581922 [Fimicolochytrium jonesii]|uniref:uncharacterized protein n=1 Tax=Fimicolochytrium jonesii TaxID=1396493 RepID=UPI0022FE0EFE|nr:uncharacterized protein EV422DRAFT_581922 [Fimicolochytrium jonesii]KAI8815693.1 hypothetical protein EV422DRAFT_581922 [Fimicolochytrium jonesii]